MSNPLHQTLMCTLKGKTLAYIVNVIPIMSERVAPSVMQLDIGSKLSTSSIS